MKKVVKIKNLIVASFVLFFLTEHNYKLIKGYQNANNVCNHHQSSTNHLENIVAHRGFSGLYLDNSVESIDAALNSNCVDMIEIDVQRTQNGKIVIHHDSFINIDDVTMKIEDLSLNEISEEDEKKLIKNYPFYNLADLLHDDQLFFYKRFLQKKVGLDETELIFLSDIIKNYSFKKPLIIDVKTEKIDIDYMIELDRILNMYKNNIFIQSDNYEFLNKMLELYPDYKYLYIINSSRDIFNKNNNFFGYTVRYGLLEKIKIENDKLYLIYTVNSSLKYYNLLKNKNYCNDMYIITDHPDYICALGESKKLRK